MGRPQCTDALTRDGDAALAGEPQLRLQAGCPRALVRGHEDVGCLARLQRAHAEEVRRRAGGGGGGGGGGGAPAGGGECERWSTPDRTTVASTCQRAACAAVDDDTAITRAALPASRPGRASRCHRRS